MFGSRLLRPAQRLTITIALVVGVGHPLSAQWFKYPTPGVPRTAAGLPDGNAPAPRTPDGKPDLSGIWLADNPLPCPDLLRDGNDCVEKTPLSREAAYIGASLRDGLPFQPWAAALAKNRAENLGKDDPHVRCLPTNIPRGYTLPHLQRVIQLPGYIAMLNEYNASYRQIFTDGRPLPDDPQPGWNGYSSARWDGDVLLVQTIGFRDDLWLDMRGTPMTGGAKLTERLRRPNFGTLLIDLTVDDPKAYTRPWTVTLKQSIVVDTELLDEICLENEKSLQHMVGK
jgi:hypothetical protein